MIRSRNIIFEPHVKGRMEQLFCIEFTNFSSFARCIKLFATTSQPQFHFNLSKKTYLYMRISFADRYQMSVFSLLLDS